MTTENTSLDGSLGEEAIIADYFKPLTRGWPGALGLADDCATITPGPGQDLVIKTDPIRAGVHFFPDDSPHDIAWKALAVNVSDLAAKAARPVAYTLALSFPKQPERAWLRSFADGLDKAQDAFGCVLIGGDTDQADGPLSLAVTVFGEVPTSKMVRRGTPLSGDKVYVSGTLGDAALGLRMRSGGHSAAGPSGPEAFLLDRYLRPQPRIGLRAALRAYATAAMDISDGLGKDLGRMCRAAGLGAIVRENRIPLSSAFQAIAPTAAEARRTLISAGDDYEILCTVRPQQSENFVALATACGVPVTHVGEITSGGQVDLIDEAGKPLDWGRAGYDHFG